MSGPSIKIGPAEPFQFLRLQISLHNEHLRKRVADRSSSGEYHTPSIVYFLQILAFQQHIKGPLAGGGGDARHIPQFCKYKAVFEKMSLVHKHHVHAELFKGQKVVLLFLGGQLFQLGFQVAPENRHLLDAPVFTLFIFHFADCGLDLVDLLFQLHDLPLF